MTGDVALAPPKTLVGPAAVEAHGLVVRYGRRAALDGVVESIQPGTGARFSLLPPDNASGNFTKVTQRVPVRIRIDSDAATRALLLPGLSVSATVDTRPGGDGGR